MNESNILIKSKGYSKFGGFSRSDYLGKIISALNPFAIQIRGITEALQPFPNTDYFVYILEEWKKIEAEELPLGFQKSVRHDKKILFDLTKT